MAIFFQGQKDSKVGHGVDQPEQPLVPYQALDDNP